MRRCKQIWAGLALLLLYGVGVNAQIVSGGGSGGGGGGTGNAANEVAVAFSATPTFTCGNATAGTATHFTVAALTANITSSTLATCTAGQPIGFHFVQDSTGGRTVAMPTNWDAVTIEATASIATDVEYWYDGTNGRLTSVNGKATPFLLAQAPERAAPTHSVSCPSGSGSMWFDSAQHSPTFCSNNAATNFVAALVKAARTANQFVTNISADGTQNTAAIANADLPGTGATTVNGQTCTLGSTCTVTIITNLITITTGTTATLSTAYTLNQEATAGTAVAYTLPTASAATPSTGQYCVTNSYNGSAANTGVLTVNTSASGQFIVGPAGTLTASGGNVTSGGAGGDAACFVGNDATHWTMYVNRGTWTLH